MQGCLDDCPPAGTGLDSSTRVRPTDLTDQQWEAVQPLMPTPKPGGRPRTVDLRAVLNAIQYVVAGHCSWRRLPDDLPRWGTVHSYFWICAPTAHGRRSKRPSRGPATDSPSQGGPLTRPSHPVPHAATPAASSALATMMPVRAQALPLGLDP